MPGAGMEGLQGPVGQNEGMGMPDMNALKEAMENMDIEMLEKMMPPGGFEALNNMKQ